MSNKCKIAVLVSGGGTNLQALIDAEAKGELGQGKIVTVIASKAGVYALERAERAGIEAFALPRKDYVDAKSYSEALRDALVEREIDLVVLAGFLTIIDEQMYDVENAQTWADFFLDSAMEKGLGLRSERLSAMSAHLTSLDPNSCHAISSSITIPSVSKLSDKRRDPL